MDVAGQFRRSIEAVGRRRNLIVFFALAHVAFFIFGQWVIANGIPAAVELRQQALGELKDVGYLKPLTGFLGGNIPLQIFYTFAFNLIVGAFFTTTATGLVFFMPYLLAVWRGFIVGMLTYGLIHSSGASVAFYGTFILEFGAYCLTSAVGTDIGLTLVWPGRRRCATRKEAVREAMRDGADIYFLAIILLFIAAIWEIGSLYIVGPLI